MSRTPHQDRLPARSIALLTTLALSLSSAQLAAGPSAAADPGDAGTERVSVTTGGAPGNGASHGVDVSGDGSVAVFGSGSTNLVPNGTSTFDIYVRDRDAGTTALVSVSSTGQSGNSTSLWPSIAADGSRVAFQTNASNLVPDDDNGGSDVIVRDRGTGTTVLVSAAPDGTPANAASARPEISADGEHVVFQSAATDLVPGVPVGVTQVYSRNLSTGVVELVSQTTAGTPADAAVGAPSVSADGRYVVFQTFAPSFENAVGYLHVRDTVEGTTKPLPGSSSRQADEPSISGDGQWVFFNNGYTGYVVRRSTGTVTTANLPFAVLSTSRFNHDGTALAVFVEDGSASRLYVWDRRSNSSTQVSLTSAGDPVASGAVAPATFGPPGISNNGRIIGFWSDADGVVSGDTGRIRDVYVRDRGDLLGPDVSDVRATPPEPAAADPVEITASVSEIGRGEAVVASAEAAVDGRAWAPMTADDGTFDSPTEDVALTVVDLGGGTHEVCVRGTDGRGNVTEEPACTTFTYATTTTPVGLTITRIAAAGATSYLTLNSQATFYARAWIVPTDGGFPSDGVADYDTRDGRGALDTILEPGAFAAAEPFVSYGEQVTTGSGVALVRIEAGLDLANGATIPIDLNPVDGQPGVTLSLDVATGLWSDAGGPVDAPVSCMSSEIPDAGTLPGEVCFGLSTLSLDGDLDRDGLLDSWEQFGLSMDGDPDLELDLPAWGATADHKDLFVEYDVENDALFDEWVEAGLVAVQEAFARAPADAAGSTNPDGRPGIRLWIDSPAADERLRLPNSPAQRRLVTPTICGVSDWWGLGDDENFYGAKKIGFDQDRRWVFRYGLKESPDEDCGSGGQAEIGGNDLLILNSDSRFETNGVIFPGGGTFMHELGHTLGLRHGGDQNSNHKPNYISLMNYRYSFTLQESGGAGYLDYSPAMAPGGSGVRPALMPAFNEAVPPQGVVLGADRDHLLLYPSLTCQYTAVPASEPFDLLPGVDGPAGPVLHPGANADMNKLPESCEFDRLQGPTALQTLTDHDDWSAIRLPFQRSGDADDGAVNPSDDEDFPDDEEVAQLRELATTSDLTLAVVGPAGPVEVATTGRVTVTVSNTGGVHAATPVATVEVPSGVGVSATGAQCAGAPLRCMFGALPPGAVTSFDLDLTPASAGPLLLRGTVADEALADSAPADNAGQVTVTVVEPSVAPPPSASPPPSPGPDPTVSPDPTISPSPTPTISPSPTPTVRPDPPSATTVKARVYFRYGSTKLTKAQKRKLRRLASKVPEGAVVTADARAMVRFKGARASDKRLALTRAKKVRAYLYRQGLDGQITVSNKGRTKSVTRTARRVNLTVTYVR